MNEMMDLYFCIEIDTFRQRCVLVLVYERVSLHFIIRDVKILGIIKTEISTIF